MADSTEYVKRATIATLKAVPALATLVADRVYPLQRPPNPVWPFVALGQPSRVPFDATCMSGSTVEFAVHNYAQTSGEGPATVTGEKRAGEINVLVDSALEGQAIDLETYGCPYPATAHYTCTLAQVIPDGAEADKFHGFVTIRVDVSS